jgi:hypothetical protein
VLLKSLKIRALAWLVAGCNTLGGGKTGYLKEKPAATRPGRPSFISGKLKVHKNENFFGFDFEFCTISLLVMSKY